MIVARTEASTLTEITIKEPKENDRTITQTLFNLFHSKSEFLSLK